MTTETVPAKRTRKTNPTPPAFDFTAVKPQETAPVVRKNGSAPLDNPTVAWLQDSWNSRVGTLGAGRKVTVPTPNVQQLRNLLNYAARDLKLGVAIRTVVKPGGKTEVHYSAKPRKQKRTPATPTTQTTTEALAS